MADNKKRLYRSRRHKMIGGVCGGIADYLDVDPTLVRVAWIVISLFPLVPGILVYIIAWIVIPKEPGVEEGPSAARTAPGTTAAFFGFFFIALGTLFLLSNLDLFYWRHWWHVSWEYVLPLLLIAAGGYVLMRPTLQGSSAPSEPEGGKASEPRENAKRLHRSGKEKKVLGVCGGLAEYLGIDPSIVRIAFIVFSLWPFGLGVVVYLLLAFVMPEEVRDPQTQS